MCALRAAERALSASLLVKKWLYREEEENHGPLTCVASPQVKITFRLSKINNSKHFCAPSLVYRRKRTGAALYTSLSKQQHSHSEEGGLEEVWSVLKHCVNVRIVQVQIHIYIFEMNLEAEDVKTAPHYYWGCCMVCGATANRSDDAFKTTTLKRCSRCHCVSYCSVEHQKLHWKYHKSLCNYLSAVAGEVGADTFFAAGTSRSNKFTCYFSRPILTSTAVVCTSRLHENREFGRIN